MCHLLLFGILSDGDRGRRDGWTGMGVKESCWIIGWMDGWCEWRGWRALGGGVFVNFVSLIWSSAASPCLCSLLFFYFLLFLYQSVGFLGFDR